MVKFAFNSCKLFNALNLGSDKSNVSAGTLCGIQIALPIGYSIADRSYDKTRHGLARTPGGADCIWHAWLILPLGRQAEDVLAVHRHDGVEVEADVMVDRGHVAPGALDGMVALQAAPAHGIEGQVHRRHRLLGYERLGAAVAHAHAERLAGLGGLPDAFGPEPASSLLPGT